MIQIATVPFNFSNQIEEMKKQTIGVEIEMNNITREKAALLAAEYFGTGRYEYTAHRNGYEKGVDDIGSIIVAWDYFKKGFLLGASFSERMHP